ncbi:unnamed protein product [Caenorhabditis nigoni]
MSQMNSMEDNFNDSHSGPQMDPMEDANKTEKLDQQSGKISNAFNDMKQQVAGREDREKRCEMNKKCEKEEVKRHY